MTDDALPDTWDDPSIAYGTGTGAATMLDEKRTELADVLVQSFPDVSRDDPDDPDEHDDRDRDDPLARRPHPWSAHPYANPLAAVNPSPPPPIRRGSARALSSPAPLPSIGTRGDDNDRDDDGGDRGGDRGGERGGGGGGGGGGDQAVNEEYAFGSRRGLSMRARMDRAGDVFGSSGNPSRGNEIGTEYIRHTDAGTVRVVELPPLYNDLRR